jgi:hypothetical protein
VATRGSMAQLITRTRSMIGDPNPAPAGCTMQFTDDYIQDTLDLCRIDIAEMRLLPKDVVDPASKFIVWTDFYAQTGPWEQDALIQGNNWQILIPQESDWLIGRWVFSDSQLLPLYITGKIYDLFEAAADLLEEWAAAASLSYDITMDQFRFQRSQMQANLLRMAQNYRRKQGLRTFSMFRSDSTGSGVYRRYFYDNDPSLGTF